MPPACLSWPSSDTATHLGFLALQRIQQLRSFATKRASLRQSPPYAFLRFRRTGPQATSSACRVCFTPTTLLSFSPSGSFLRSGILTRSRVRSSRAVSAPPVDVSSGAKKTARLGSRGFEGLILLNSLSLRECCHPLPGSTLLDFFSSLRLSLSSPSSSASCALPSTPFQTLSNRGRHEFAGP